jgi:hypothetical protein
MKHKRESGGVLLATLVFVIILSTAASSILALSLYSHRLSLRNDLRAQARAVAETEMDWIFYHFMDLILNGASPGYTSSPNATTLLAANLPCDTGAAATTVLPTTNRSPYLLAHQTDGWIVRRSVVYNQHKEGIVASTGKRGAIDYIDVRVEVLPPPSSPFAGSFSVRIGRYFSCAVTSIFQNAIFFQGDLEMAPGGNMTITGDISANGSIYMGAGPIPGSGPPPVNGTLTINNQVTYLQGYYFNQDSTGATVYRKPGTPGTTTLSPPVFGTSEASQVHQMTSQQNLLGGIDASAVATARPDLFPSVNDVYRSLIAPPPADATAQEYPDYPLVGTSSAVDDPTINAQRMYTRANLHISVDNDGTPHFTKNTSPDPASPNWVACDSDFANVLTDFSPFPHTPPQYFTSVTDQREGVGVYMTEIDVSALTTAITNNFPGFNGALYVNLKNAYSNHPSAVRLTNASSTPMVGNGFSVATNGGIYVLGDYNTTQTGTDGSGNPIYNPAMLMGDSVTLLSAPSGPTLGWHDTNADSPISQRVAHSASGTVSVNAGVLTGNVSATSTNASGGAQNLIRYLENWTGINVSVNGSLGRLFDSKYFIQPWQQPGTIYVQPASRNFSYANSFQTAAPPESPSTTDLNRGGFFNW